MGLQGVEPSLTALREHCTACVRAVPSTGEHQARTVPPVGLEPTPSRRFRPEPYPLGRSGSDDLGETRTPNLQIRILLPSTSPRTRTEMNRGLSAVRLPFAPGWHR